MVPPSPCYPRPSITLDECISRRRRERFEILPRLGVRADEKNCNRIGVFFQLAIVERSSASNDRPSGHGGFFFSFPLFPFSLSLSLFKLVGLPRKINLPAFFRPSLRAFSTTIVDSIFSFSFASGKYAGHRFEFPMAKCHRLVAISVRRVFLPNEFQHIDPAIYSPSLFANYI